jgi:phospholipase C
LAIGIVSEPHYVWMEAGTNSFSDHTFSSDDAPSASNSTASTAHLATQLTAKGLTWMSYQEGIDGTSGACPIQASGYYQPKHDPFIFFRDVSGSPPAKSNAGCAAHHKEYGKLADDLKNQAVANYNFITPNQCHDMHGQSGCPNSNTIKAGDDWLRQNLPALITFSDAHDGVIFIVWDEGESSQQIPFLAIGARVKSHYVSAVEYDHSSLVKTVETIFELPVLSKVSAAHDFADLFNAGQFP